MARSAFRRAPVALAIVALPYWPPSLAETSYPDRVAVVNTIGRLPHLREALHEWNSCGSRLRLVRDRDQAPFTPSTITITRSDDGGAYGGWSGTYGVVFLGDGWTRTLNVITHEVGHALGFSHTKLRSAMNDASGTTPLDCKGLRSYYRR